MEDVNLEDVKFMGVARAKDDIRVWVVEV